jgi:hypothetical protein
MEAPALIVLGIEFLFYVLLLAFVVHAIVLGYHWFMYGNNPKINMLALCIYLCGGAVLFLTISGALAIL